MSLLPESWDRLLNRPFDREPHRTTLLRAEAERMAHTVYPPREDWFSAFRLTAPEEVRAVILGQDPYHEEGQAMGLSFSVRRGVRLPPSLRNMYRELSDDLGCRAPESGDLSAWARQGVLLLNTVLTVEAGRANSHKDLGWQAFTREVLTALIRLPQPICFVLWGAPAQRAYAQAAENAAEVFNGRPPEAEGGRDQDKGAVSRSHPLSPAQPDPKMPVEDTRSSTASFPRLILQSPHPSPLSAYRGFFGSRPYSRINEFLLANGEPPIRWSDG